MMSSNSSLARSVRWLICICPVLLLWHNFYGDLDDISENWQTSRSAFGLESNVEIHNAVPSYIAAKTSPVRRRRSAKVVVRGWTHLEKQMKLTAKQKPSNICTRGHIVMPIAFGAVGDGITDDTASIRKLFQYGSDCPGTIIVIGPAEAKFLVVPGKITVELNHAVVRFEGEIWGPSLEAWNPLLLTWPKGSCAYAEADCSNHSGQNPEYARSKWTLLHVFNSTNVSFEGPGGLRAPGSTYWNVRFKQPGVRAYCLFKIDNSYRIQLSGLSLTDSPMYHLILMHSRYLDVRALRIALNVDITDFGRNYGKWGPENTDGVNILGSEDVHIADSEITSGDDNVVIKEASRRVIAERLYLRYGKGINIGSLGEGSASQFQTVDDLIFREVRVDRCRHGVRIKTWKGGHGRLRNVSFQNFSLNKVQIGVHIDQYYCPPAQRPEGCDGSNDSVEIVDVNFTNFAGTFLTTGSHHGAVDVHCEKCSGVNYEKINMIAHTTVFA